MDTLLQKSPATPALHGASADLSAEIARQVQRQAGDLVKVRRVSPSMYRCNWFTPEQEGALVTGYRVRDSRFLRATRVDGRLVIQDMTAQAAGKN